jgi:uncharacterized membrane protein
MREWLMLAVVVLCGLLVNETAHAARSRARSCPNGQCGLSDAPDKAPTQGPSEKNADAAPEQNPANPPATPAAPAQGTTEAGPAAPAAPVAAASNGADSNGRSTATRRVARRFGLVRRFR